MSASPTSGSTFGSAESDVLIVGYGPVGQVLAIQLAQKGWDVTVVERWPEPYTLPRAVAFDGEAARILAAIGISGSFDEIGESSRDYTVENAAGQTLFRLDVQDNGRYGWPDSTSMYQPGLEAALAERGRAFPNLHVHRGYEAVRLADRGDRVELLAVSQNTSSQLALKAKWVVGCDGANSFVRESLGTTFTDFGFNYDWLVCDVVLNEPRVFSPNNLQLADPVRPRVAVSAGPEHRRWEFMRMPGETMEEFNTEETAWRLLGLCDISPDMATLKRFTAYTFQARMADSWRSGRIMLAGDSAHLMPPFAGQGMCSGFRDAANLAWKLDLVLSGRADDGLLDSYTVERRAHVRNAITMSVNLGKAICMTDAKAAADRDTMMIAARERGMGAARPQTVLESLADGFLHRDQAGTRVAPAGRLTPQGRVARGETTGLFDEVAGLGFVLLTEERPELLLEADQLAFLGEAGVRLVQLLPAGTPSARAGGDAVVDVDGVHLPYLRELGAAGALVRPDWYLFGAARDRAGLGALVDDLRSRLAAPALVG